MAGPRHFGFTPRPRRTDKTKWAPINIIYVTFHTLALLFYLHSWTPQLHSMADASTVPRYQATAAVNTRHTFNEAHEHGNGAWDDLKHDITPSPPPRSLEPLTRGSAGVRSSLLSMGQTSPPPPNTTFVSYEAEITLPAALAAGTSLPAVPGAVLHLSYNFLTVTLRFQLSSPYGTCTAQGAHSTLSAVVAAAFGLPPSNVTTTSCKVGGAATASTGASPPSAGSSSSSSRNSSSSAGGAGGDGGTDCSAEVATQVVLVLKLDQAISLESFGTAVFRTLYGSGSGGATGVLTGLCPGETDTSLAVPGALVRGVSTADSSFTGCQAFVAVLLAAMEPLTVSAASSTGPSLSVALTQASCRATLYGRTASSLPPPPPSPLPPALLAARPTADGGGAAADMMPDGDGSGGASSSGRASVSNGYSNKSVAAIAAPAAVGGVVVLVVLVVLLLCCYRRRRRELVTEVEAAGTAVDGGKDTVAEVRTPPAAAAAAELTPPTPKISGRSWLWRSLFGRRSSGSSGGSFSGRGGSWRGTRVAPNELKGRPLEGSELSGGGAAAAAVAAAAAAGGCGVSNPKLAFIVGDGDNAGSGGGGGGLAVVPSVRAPADTGEGDDGVVPTRRVRSVDSDALLSASAASLPSSPPRSSAEDTARRTGTGIGVPSSQLPPLPPPPPPGQVPQEPMLLVLPPTTTSADSCDGARRCDGGHIRANNYGGGGIASGGGSGDDAGNGGLFSTVMESGGSGPGLPSVRKPVGATLLPSLSSVSSWASEAVAALAAAEPSAAAGLLAEEPSMASMPSPSTAVTAAAAVVKEPAALETEMERVSEASAATTAAAAVKETAAVAETEPSTPLPAAAAIKAPAAIEAELQRASAATAAAPLADASSLTAPAEPMMLVAAAPAASASPSMLGADVGAGGPAAAAAGLDSPSGPPLAPASPAVTSSHMTLVSGAGPRLPLLPPIGGNLEHLPQLGPALAPRSLPVRNVLPIVIPHHPYSSHNHDSSAASVSSPTAVAAAAAASEAGGDGGSGGKDILSGRLPSPAVRRSLLPSLATTVPLAAGSLDVAKAGSPFAGPLSLGQQRTGCADARGREGGGGVAAPLTEPPPPTANGTADSAGDTAVAMRNTAVITLASSSCSSFSPLAAVPFSPSGGAFGESPRPVEERRREKGVSSPGSGGSGKGSTAAEAAAAVEAAAAAVAAAAVAAASAASSSAAAAAAAVGGDGWSDPIFARPDGPDAGGSLRGGDGAAASGGGDAPADGNNSAVRQLLRPGDGGASGDIGDGGDRGAAASGGGDAPADGNNSAVRQLLRPGGGGASGDIGDGGDRGAAASGGGDTPAGGSSSAVRQFRRPGDGGASGDIGDGGAAASGGGDAPACGSNSAVRQLLRPGDGGASGDGGDDGATASGGGDAPACGGNSAIRQFHRPGVGGLSSSDLQGDDDVAAAATGAGARTADWNPLLAARNFKRPDGDGDGGEELGGDSDSRAKPPPAKDLAAPSPPPGAAARAMKYGAGIAPEAALAESSVSVAESELPSSSPLPAASPAATPPAAAAAAAGRQFKFGGMADGKDPDDVDGGLDSGSNDEEELNGMADGAGGVEGQKEQRTRLRALRPAAARHGGGSLAPDEALGSVDLMQLQLERRRKAQLEQMRNKAAWGVAAGGGGEEQLDHKEQERGDGLSSVQPVAEPL